MMLPAEATEHSSPTTKESSAGPAGAPGGMTTIRREREGLTGRELATPRKTGSRTPGRPGADPNTVTRSSASGGMSSKPLPGRTIGTPPTIGPDETIASK